MDAKLQPLVPAAPRGLRELEARRQRRALLDLPHVAPLKEYAARLRRSGTLEVPDFDPLDGGVDARVLFLLEKPGPMTSASGARTGSGFISRDNDDATAEAIFKFMNQAGIRRKSTVIWNLIPWWNGTRKVMRQERLDGLAATEELLALLPQLVAVVLVGGTALRAADHFRSKGLGVVLSAHPSPIVRATAPAKWDLIPDQWSKVMTYLTEER